jgi:hypothetical protein
MFDYITISIERAGIGQERENIFSWRRGLLIFDDRWYFSELDISLAYKDPCT